MIRVDPVAVHDHPNPDQLHIGCPGCIERAYPTPSAFIGEVSATRRRTIRNNSLLAAGTHPATLQPVQRDTTNTCGTCVHHVVVHHHNNYFHKCEQHRLGKSHSGASDIRVGWPACTLHQPIETDQ